MITDQIIDSFPFLYFLKEVVDDFKMRCCVGKNGLNSQKEEGDFSTPKGLFNLKKYEYNSYTNILTKTLDITDLVNKKIYNELS